LHLCKKKLEAILFFFQTNIPDRYLQWTTTASISTRYSVCSRISPFLRVSRATLILSHNSSNRSWAHFGFNSKLCYPFKTLTVSSQYQVNWAQTWFFLLLDISAHVQIIKIQRYTSPWYLLEVPILPTWIHLTFKICNKTKSIAWMI